MPFFLFLQYALSGRAHRGQDRIGTGVGSVPYGYRRNGNGLEKDAGEQAVVSLVTNFYRRFSRLHDICRVLKEKHITTRNGRPFSPQQVKRIVTGYENCFSKENTRLSQNIRQFISAIA